MIFAYWYIIKKYIIILIVNYIYKCIHCEYKYCKNSSYELYSLLQNKNKTHYKEAVILSDLGELNQTSM